MNPSPIDHCAELVAGKAPQFYRGVMMASVEKRPFMLALLALDIELWMAARASKEEMVNAIKLAWWAAAVERLPEGEDQHPVLAALVETSIPKELITQMVSAYQEGRESLPIMIRAMSEHLGANPDDMIALIHAVAKKQHQPRKWPPEARPIVAMIAPMKRGGAVKLALIGRG